MSTQVANYVRELPKVHSLVRIPGAHRARRPRRGFAALDELLQY